MRAAVRKLGNSAGVIIPKSLLSELGVRAGDVIDMTAEEGRIVIVPVKREARAGWARASEEIAAAGGDDLVWPEFTNADDDSLEW
jgi:antitoxin MazE